MEYENRGFEINMIVKNNFLKNHTPQLKSNFRQLAEDEDFQIIICTGQINIPFTIITKKIVI